MHGHDQLLWDIIRTAFALASALAGGLVTLALAYCLALLLVAAIASRRRQISDTSKPTTRFAILIPAHNEELVIGATLDWLSRTNYPSHLLNVIVIADNCSDATVSIVRGSTHAPVLERSDLDNPGKPAALNWATQQGRREVEECDAIVIMDADTRMDTAFLGAMDAAFRRAGSRQFAAQGRYDVLNPDDGWRTALMAGALSLVHVVRPLAREAMHLSVGLKGNGMCFSRDLLKQMPWNPHSLTEDIELGLDLIEKKGIRVQYVPEAIVAAQMPVTQSAAEGQRRRWEGGRSKIARERTLGLLSVGLTKGSAVAIDAAVDLILPPLAQLGALLALWGALTAVGMAIHALPTGFAIWWCGGALSLAAYVIGGFAVGGAPKGAYAALVRAPFYAVWKLTTLLNRRNVAKTAAGDDAWVRTERAPITPVTGESPVPTGRGGVE